MDERISSFCVGASESFKELYRLETASLNDSNSSPIFANKYKIRGILVDQVGRAKALLTTGDTSVVLLWAYFTAKLANNFIETEEPRAEARNRLLEVVNYCESHMYLESEGNLLKFSGLLQYVYNSLAVATDVEDDNKTKSQSALFWLEKAKSLYEKFKLMFSGPEAPECWESLAASNLPPEHSCLVKSVMFETGYTTTLFMLAQVYGNKSEKRKASELCRETLQRQLQFAPVVDELLDLYGVAKRREMGEVNKNDSFAVSPSDWLINTLQRFDPKDWANNTATLSEFYAENGEFINALECLMTAKSVACEGTQSVDNEDLGQSLSGTKLWADISWRMSEYALRLLERGSKAILGSRFTTNEDGVDTPSELYGSLFGQNTTRALQEAYGEVTKDVNLSTMIIELSNIPKAYPTAARLFKWTCRSLSEALIYYRLDERCTEAIQLIRVHANAYAFLSIFEMDISRKCCMQKRRVDILENLLAQLNPRFYMLACRNIMYEGAEALTALRDLNEEKMKRTAAKASSPSSSSTTDTVAEIVKLGRKVNGLGLRALNMYKQLLDSFLTPADQSEPHLYEEEWLPIILMAHFYSARLHSKTIVTGPLGNRVGELSLALKAYEKMVAIADRHAKSGYKVDMPEVEIAREMAQLTAGQIARTQLLDA